LFQAGDDYAECGEQSDRSQVTRKGFDERQAKKAGPDASEKIGDMFADHFSAELIDRAKGNEDRVARFLADAFRVKVSGQSRHDKDPACGPDCMT